MWKRIQFWTCTMFMVLLIAMPVNAGELFAIQQASPANILETMLDLVAGALDSLWEEAEQVGSGLEPEGGADALKDEPVTQEGGPGMEPHGSPESEGSSGT